MAWICLLRDEADGEAGDGAESTESEVRVCAACGDGDRSNPRARYVRYASASHVYEQGVAAHAFILPRNSDEFRTQTAGIGDNDANAHAHGQLDRSLRRDRAECKAEKCKGPRKRHWAYRAGRFTRVHVGRPMRASAKPAATPAVVPITMPFRVSVR